MGILFKLSFHSGTMFLHAGFLVSFFGLCLNFPKPACRGACATRLISGTGIAGTSNFGGGGGLADTYGGYGSSGNNNYAFQQTLQLIRRLNNQQNWQQTSNPSWLY